MSRCGQTAAGLLVATALQGAVAGAAPAMTATTDGSVALPSYEPGAGPSVAEALARRRSVREFADRALTLGHVSAMLWAAQGRTAAGGLRPAPSAGALFPLEIYLVAGAVEGLAAGVYRYQGEAHRLVAVAEGDRRRALASAAFAQSWLADAPAIIVIAAVYDRTTSKYGERGIRYVAMEAGHAGQNLYLQAAALGLGTCVVGAFDDRHVKEVVALARQEDPLALYPVGWPRGGPGATPGR